jgi:hypothetical protein
MSKKIKLPGVIKKNTLLFILSILLVIFYSLFFPALESPDEVEHLNRILIGGEIGLWGEILQSINNTFFNENSLDFIYEKIRNPNFNYLGNNFLYLSAPAPYEYYLLRLLNCLVVISFFIFIVKIFNGNKMAIMWPSATYYMSLLTSEGMAYALMLGSSSNTKFKIFMLLFICVALIFLDRSIYVFIGYLVIKLTVMFFSRNDLVKFKNFSKYIFLISIFVYLLSVINYEMIMEYITIPEVRQIMSSLQNLDPSHFSQFIVFIFTFLILTGSLSFYPTILFHAFILYLLSSAIFFANKIKKDKPELNEIFGSLLIGLSIYLLVSSIAPQLSHFRYYLFLVPPVVSIFLLRYHPNFLFYITLFVTLYNIIVIKIMNIL